MIKLFGIALRLHPLFLLIMIASILTGYYVELLTLFGIVLIHELGHVAAAKSVGWRVREIELLPFGGVAVMDTAGGDRAWEEIWVAIAGPLQNGLMAGFGYAMVRLGGWAPEWGTYFITSNALIAGFNLLPVPPLDGGKILQSLLSTRLPYYQTLRACAWLGMTGSAGLAAGSVILSRSAGIQVNLLAVGIYLFAINWMSLRHQPYVFMRYLMGREMRVDGMLRRGVRAETLLVGEQASIAQILKKLKRGRIHLIGVLHANGALRGTITEKQLLRGYFLSPSPDARVASLLP